MHFWPVFDVISRTTSRTKKSNDGEPGAASGPEQRGIQAVGFDVHAHALLANPGC